MSARSCSQHSQRLTWNLALHSAAFGSRRTSPAPPIKGKVRRSCLAPSTPSPDAPFIRRTVSFHLSVSSLVFSNAASRSILSCSRPGRGAAKGPALLRIDLDEVATGVAEPLPDETESGLSVLRKAANLGFFESEKVDSRSSKSTLPVESDLFQICTMVRTKKP